MAKALGCLHEVLGTNLGKSSVWNLYVIMYSMYVYIVDVQM
jgi:hypothetical protein